MGYTTSNVFYTKFLQTPVLVARRNMTHRSDDLVPPDRRPQPALAHRPLDRIRTPPLLDCDAPRRGRDGRLVHPVLALDAETHALVLVEVEVGAVGGPDPSLFVVVAE